MQVNPAVETHVLETQVQRALLTYSGQYIPPGRSDFRETELEYKQRLFSWLVLQPSQLQWCKKNSFNINDSDHILNIHGATSHIGGHHQITTRAGICDEVLVSYCQ